MNLTDYILLNREERTSHIDLSTSCQFGVWRNEKHLDFFDLSDNVDNWRGKIGRNHLCPNDTKCGGPICTNPLHWYYGTNLENMGDVEDQDRFKVGGRSNKGRKFPPRTEEQKLNHSLGSKNRPPISEETRRKMSNSARNKPPVSDEAKKRMSLSRLGKKRGPYKTK